MNHGDFFQYPRHWHVIEVSGPDARDFLQRVTSADFRKLNPSQWAEGALLAATGKIQVYFRAQVATADTFRLFTPWDLKPAFDAFDKMHFGEKLSLTTLTWEQFRIEKLIPSHPAEINDSVNPLEIGLGGAVHDNKGCYPGQEVLEKIRSYGKVPRLLIGVEGTGSPPDVSPTPLFDTTDPQRELGTLTSAVACPRQAGHWIGLALVQRAAHEQGLALGIQGRGGAICGVAARNAS